MIRIFIIIVVVGLAGVLWLSNKTETQSEPIKNVTTCNEKTFNDNGEIGINKTPNINYSWVNTNNGKEYLVTFKCPPENAVIKMKPGGINMTIFNPSSPDKLNMVMVIDQWYGYQLMDKSKPVEVWFKELLSKKFSDLETNSISFSEVTYGNKTYIKVSNFPASASTDTITVIMQYSVFYIPVQTPELLIQDNNALFGDNAEIFLGSLEITKK